MTVTTPAAPPLPDALDALLRRLRLPYARRTAEHAPSRPVTWSPPAPLSRLSTGNGGSAALANSRRVCWRRRAEGPVAFHAAAETRRSLGEDRGGGSDRFPARGNSQLVERPRRWRPRCLGDETHRSRRSNASKREVAAVTPTQPAQAGPVDKVKGAIG